MSSSPALTVAFGVVAAVFGIVFALKASSIADVMWTQNESLTRHSRLLAMPRDYYLWLCRLGGIALSIIATGLVIGAVISLMN
ncbi:hypothetical protein [Microbacterium allomyrinae]|uniref:Uncharacterized protein n=1 Tax=Microbacterium allomyrinae TaxID=2830666 RepID=A0A9X1LV74_9MICO|nr:hypothetical protein [Microbacterium allomyrinae]MCC2032689.1 hypothetical protein [Microbacterium allomyrinae]